MELSGVVTRNLARQVVSLTGDATFTSPCRLAKVTTNGFALTVSTLAHHGITIDGSKDPAQWGANVHFSVPIFPQNATHTMAVMGMDADGEAIIAKVGTKVGPDGIAMWSWLVDYIHANPAATPASAKTAWSAWSTATENAVYFDLAVSFLQKTFSTWANLKTQILAKTPEAWKGLSVPTGEVIS